MTGGMSNHKTLHLKNWRTQNTSKNIEDQIHFFIKHSKAFYEDDQGNVFYVKQETESDWDIVLVHIFLLIIYMIVDIFEL